jgi:SAM-dependent methyltransferase
MFLRYIFESVPIPSQGLVVEIGGGAGLHGRILGGLFGSRYLFTDISGNLVQAARGVGLRATQMDGLAMALGDRSAACTVLVAPSTLLYEQDTRERQFRECARILKPGGVGIFVTARRDPRYHCFDRRDAELLSKLGFLVTSLNWGVIPGRLWTAWNRHFFGVIERIAANTDLPARIILIARRSART